MCSKFRFVLEIYSILPIQKLLPKLRVYWPLDLKYDAFSTINLHFQLDKSVQMLSTTFVLRPNMSRVLARGKMFSWSLWPFSDLKCVRNSVSYSKSTPYYRSSSCFLSLESIDLSIWNTMHSLLEICISSWTKVFKCCLRRLFCVLTCLGRLFST